MGVARRRLSGALQLEGGFGFGSGGDQWGAV